MIKNRKFMLIAALGLILCLIISVSLTACGGGSQEAATEEPAAEETQPEAAEPEATQPEEEAPAAESGSDEQELIGEEKALEIALKDAGIKQDDTTFSKVELDYDDDTGRQEYEVQFNVGTTEYEYNLDAITGEITEKDIDND